MTPYWPWWAGALALAAVAVAHELFTNRPLAVSGQLGHALGAPRAGGTRTDALLFLGALAGGGLLAGLAAPVADGAPVWRELSPMAARLFSLPAGDPADMSGPLAALLIGGALVGFGTSLAGGCTSGHGLVGCARARPTSLVVTAAFFGTAVAVAGALTGFAGVHP